jgi:hypothetical protein
METKYYEDKGSYKEIIQDEKGLFVCPFCSERFRALAYHTRQKHGISAKQLRKSMGLKSNYQLITDDIRERHREIALDNDEATKLILVGKNTRYKKGHIGHIKKNWSTQALKQLRDRGKKYEEKI